MPFSVDTNMRLQRNDENVERVNVLPDDSGTGFSLSTVDLGLYHLGKT